MSPTEIVSPNKKDEEEEDPPCNVCHEAPGTKKCSKCKIRRYCSVKCQKADWKMHKRYCGPPPTKEQRIQYVKETLDQFKDVHGMTFERLCESVGQDPENPHDIEKLIEASDKVLDKLKLAMEKVSGSKTPESYPWTEDKSWCIANALDELEELPELWPDGYVYSWSTMGQMDKDTGELCYVLSSVNMQSGKVRATTFVTGHPTRRDLEQSVYASMAMPMPGCKPARPCVMLFAHRWGEENVGPIKELMTEKFGIACRLESRQEAISSARQNDTDPDGYNF